MIEQGKAGRREARNLPGELAADGAARPGDEDSLARDQLAHRRRIQHLARPSQEILDGDRHQGLLGVAVGMMQLGHPRQAGQGHAPRLGDGDELAKPFAIDPVIGQDEALRRLAPGAEPLQHGGRLAERRQDRHAMDAPAHPAAAAIQYADHRIGGGGVAPRHPDEGLGRIAGPHQQHRHGERAGPLAELAQIAVAQQAIAEAGRAQEDDQHEPVDQHR